jgi:hypothetical protein
MQTVENEYKYRLGFDNEKRIDYFIPLPKLRIPGDSSGGVNKVENLVAYHVYCVGLTFKRRMLSATHITIFFNDEFGWMGVGKSNLKQIVYIITAGEFEHGQRKSKKLVNFPILLSKAENQRDYPHELLQIFTDDLIKLSQGQLFDIMGEMFFVVALTHAIVGDLPARKSIIGMKSSVSSSVPCHFCKTFSSDFKSTITIKDCEGLKRKSQEFQSCLSLQSGSDTPRLMNLSYNIVKVSELKNWLCQINPSSVLTDLVHQKYLGDYGEHFKIFLPDVGKINKLTGVRDEVGRRRRRTLILN